MSDQIQIVFMIFTGLIFLSVLIQLIFIVGMSVAVLQTRKKVNLLIDELRVHGLPLIKSSRQMVDEYSPKVKVAIGNFVDASEKARTTAAEASETAKSLLQQLRGYADRTDKAVSGTVNKISKAGNTVQRGISGPLRQVSGLVNAFRAGLTVICTKEPAVRREESRRGAETSIPREPAASASAPPGAGPLP